MDTEKKVAEILLNIRAVSLNPVNPFKYASGMFSPIYTDCRVINSYPNERRIIIELLVDYIRKKIGLSNIDIIVGTAHSGISLATYLTEKLNLPMAYIRSSIKDHGKGKQIEGAFKKGYRALLVSDIISTEEDIPISVRVIKKNGGEVIHCLTIFNNNLEIIDKFLEKEKIKSYSLTNLKTLLSLAFTKNKISSPEQNSVTEWIKNPAEWDKLRKEKIKKITKENKERIAEILLKIKAVTLNTKEPYKFVSGILSPIYTDSRLLMSHPKEWKEVIDSFVNAIISVIGTQNINVIAGTSTAGISHAAYLSERLSLPMIYVKSDIVEPFPKELALLSIKEYGEFKKIEGHLSRGNKVLVVEDLISTGGSSISTAKAIKKAGGIVNYCLAIFTYGMEKSKKAFDEENVNLLALTDLDRLLKVAVKKGYIKLEEKESVLEWAKNPAEWGKKMGFEK